VSADLSRLSEKLKSYSLPAKGTDKYPEFILPMTIKSLPVDDPPKTPVRREMIPFERSTTWTDDCSSRNLDSSEMASAREELFMFIRHQFGPEIEALCRDSRRLY